MDTELATPEVVTLPVVVFGRDEKGKPHASRFDPADAELAERAAGLMGMRVLRVASDEQSLLAAGLPAGRVFASGRGFVPFVKAKLFAKLEAAPDAFEPKRPATPASAAGEPDSGLLAETSADVPGESDDAPASPGEPPSDWAAIKVGSLVLAAEEGIPARWYVVTVVTERGDDLFELRWFEDADGELPLIVRRREHLGLFPPTLAGTLA